IRSRRASITVPSCQVGPAPGTCRPGRGTASAEQCLACGAGRGNARRAPRQLVPRIASRASMNAATARSTSAVECAAESWTLIRARSIGTTGYEKPIT
ncbi:hypothetical protein GA0115259_113731, partial [Streptomyces sp. MnatMP-M17]